MFWVGACADIGAGSSQRIVAVARVCGWGTLRVRGNAASLSWSDEFLRGWVLGEAA